MKASVYRSSRTNASRAIICAYSFESTRLVRVDSLVLRSHCGALCRWCASAWLQMGDPDFGVLEWLLLPRQDKSKCDPVVPIQGLDSSCWTWDNGIAGWQTLERCWITVDEQEIAWYRVFELFNCVTEFIRRKCMLDIYLGRSDIYHHVCAWQDLTFQSNRREKFSIYNSIFDWLNHAFR